MESKTSFKSCFGYLLFLFHWEALVDDGCEVNYIKVKYICLTPFFCKILLISSCFQTQIEFLALYYSFVNSINKGFLATSIRKFLNDIAARIVSWTITLQRCPLSRTTDFLWGFFVAVVKKKGGVTKPPPPAARSGFIKCFWN